MGETIITFETNEIILKYPLDIGYNDNKFPYAYGEENYIFMPHQKYILIQEYESSTLKNEYEFLYKKVDKLKENRNEGIIEYGNNFMNCEIIHDRD